MAYNILMDTSIYVNQCFCFDNKFFKGLSKLRQAGLINLFITDVVKTEVENRIQISVTSGTKTIKKEARILDAYLALKPKDIINDLTKKFHDYIAINFMEELEVPDYSIGRRIINNYLKNKPPFDNTKVSKKQEFPDAFIIETFASYLETNSLTGIFLSSDKDCKTFIEGNKRIEYINDAGVLLDKLNRENEEYTLAISQAMNNMESNLRIILNNFISNLDIDNYTYGTHELSHYSFYDFDISSVDYISDSLEFVKTDYEIYDIDPEAKYIQLAVPVTYQISSILFANSYDNAAYDKEDDRYYFVENIEIDNKFQIENVEVIVGFNLANNEFEILSETNEINAEFNIDEPLDREEGTNENS